MMTTGLMVLTLRGTRGLFLIFTLATVAAAFDCDNTIFDDSDIYECDDGECILRGFRCDGHDDCADGSDEGAENCGDVIAGSVVGGLAGIMIFCVCPCVTVGLCIWWQKRKQAHPLQSTYIVPTTPYQPYVPPPNTTTFQPTPGAGDYRSPAVPTAPAVDSGPPPYPAATDFPTYPTFPSASGGDIELKTGGFSDEKSAQ